MTEDERKAISGFTFLTTKPVIIALNIDEDDLRLVPGVHVTVVAPAENQSGTSDRT